MKRLRRHRGVTLIELLVGISILGLLMVMAAPGLSEWLANARVRASAEALSASLQFAKGEAVARNARVRFQLTSTLGADCAINTTGPHWVVNMDPDANAAAVAGNCGSALSDTVAPRLLSRHNGRAVSSKPAPPRWCSTASAASRRCRQATSCSMCAAPTRLTASPTAAAAPACGSPCRPWARFAPATPR